MASNATNTQDPKRCRICGQQFPRHPHLIEHHKTEHHDDGGVYQCGGCPMSTDDFYSLQRHIRKSCKGGQSQAGENGSGDVEMEDPPEKGIDNNGQDEESQGQGQSESGGESGEEEEAENIDAVENMEHTDDLEAVKASEKQVLAMMATDHSAGQAETLEEPDWEQFG